MDGVQLPHGYIKKAEKFPEIPGTPNTFNGLDFKKCL